LTVTGDDAAELWQPLQAAIRDHAESIMRTWDERSIALLFLDLKVAAAPLCPDSLVFARRLGWTGGHCECARMSHRTARLVADLLTETDPSDPAIPWFRLRVPRRIFAVWQAGTFALNVSEAGGLELIGGDAQREQDAN
jgi:hypothetical protein